MLTMVGGALKKINGVKETNKLGSQFDVNKKDATVLQYKPTPIHILKAKSAGLQYDPVSNFSALSSRVTLPSCTKRSRSIDAVIPTKRSKAAVGDDDRTVEAKFSDSDGEQITANIHGSCALSTADTNEPLKCGESRLLQSSAFEHSVAKEPYICKSSSLKTLSTNLPVYATTAKLSATQSEMRDLENCSSASETTLTVNSNCPESAKLQSAALNKGDSSGKQHSSSSKAFALEVEKQHADEDHHTFSSSKSKKLSAETAAHSKKIKTNSSNGCISKHSSSHSHHKEHKSTHQKNSEQQQTATVASSNVHSSQVIGVSRHHHKFGDDKNSDGRKTSKAKHRSSKDSDNHSCQSSDVTSEKQSSKNGRSHDSTLSKSDRVKSIEKNCSIQKHGHSNDKYRKNHTHNNFEHGDRKAAAPDSHRDNNSEDVLTETLSHSKKGNSSSSVDKHTSSQNHTKEHKTSHHTKSKHKQSGSSVHSTKEDESHKEPCKSKTLLPLSVKKGKSSDHRHSKHRESASMTDGQCTRLGNRIHTKACHSNTVTSESSLQAEVKHISALQSIELFGEDSDTESILLQSPAPAQQALSRSSVASHPSLSSGDEVILLPTDDLSSDTDDTFEQCQQLYNDLARQQQSKTGTCTSSASDSVSQFFQLLALLF